jgi:hypothetical protein
MYNELRQKEIQKYPSRESPCYKVIKKNPHQSKRCKLSVTSQQNHTQISGQSMDVDNLWSQTLLNNSYLRYKCKKLSFIARTGLKYDRGTREYFKECECNKGTFYTYVLQHFIYDHNFLLLIIILFVIF